MEEVVVMTLLAMDVVVGSRHIQACKKTIYYTFLSEVKVLAPVQEVEVVIMEVVMRVIKAPVEEVEGLLTLEPQTVPLRIEFLLLVVAAALAMASPYQDQEGLMTLAIVKYYGKGKLPQMVKMAVVAAAAIMAVAMGSIIKTHHEVEAIMRTQNLQYYILEHQPIRQMVPAL